MLFRSGRKRGDCLRTDEQCRENEKVNISILLKRNIAHFYLKAKLPLYNCLLILHYVHIVRLHFFDLEQPYVFKKLIFYVKTEV